VHRDENRDGNKIKRKPSIKVSPLISAIKVSNEINVLSIVHRYLSLLAIGTTRRFPVTKVLFGQIDLIAYFYFQFFFCLNGP